VKDCNYSTIASGAFHSRSLGNTAGIFLLLPDHSKTVKCMLCAFAGQSMLPTLVEGDLLELAEYGSQPVRVGDIICFRSPNDGYLVVHRVLSVCSDRIRTRGDNNARADDRWVCPEEIVGRVITARRGRRRYKILRGNLVTPAIQLQRLARRTAGRLGRLMRAPSQSSFTQTVFRFLSARLKGRY
jgi:signal peptidase I